MNTDCPKSDWLENFESGRLSDGTSQPIERHVSQCHHCSERMRRIRQSNVDARYARDLFRKVDSTRILAFSGDSGGSNEAGRRMPTSVVLTRSVSDGGTISTGTSMSHSAWPISDYERIQLCGEGAYGSVWAVRDRVGVYRALKLIDLERIGRASASQRERSALETYCRTVHRHPYLVTVYHIGMVDHLLYYTMELADDCNSIGMVRDKFPPNYRPLMLETLVRRGRLQIDVAMELARRLLRGLSKLHNLDLVHRDVKPSNVIFVNRQPKLADIGMVSTETEAGIKIGTPEYMPPDKVMNKTADTYAFGKVLHQMIAGRNASTFPSLPPDRMHGSQRWDMARLNELIVRACSPKAEDRYANAGLMLEDLDACADLQIDSLMEPVPDDEFTALPSTRRAFVSAAIEASSKSEGTDDERTVRRSEAAEVAIAFARAVPWILGFVTLMLAMFYGMRILGF